MGRLTLNVLLSFAQFEREVTGERIRDKIAASKKKGLWMGGPVPLGYDVRERKLVVNEREAETVRAIYRRYRHLGSVKDLIGHLERDGLRTKVQMRTSTGPRGGIPFGRGCLYHLLKNRIYLGEIVHKGTAYPGEHQAIVPLELWHDVQRRLAERTRVRRLGKGAEHPSLLTGLLRDGEGRPMSPSHANKGPKRYRYYVTHEARVSRQHPAWRVPAHDLEAIVVGRLVQHLADPAARLSATDRDPGEAERRLEQSARARDLLASGSAREQRQVLLDHVAMVALHEERLAITLADQNPGGATSAAHPPTLMVAAVRVRRGRDIRLVIAGPEPTGPKRDARLVQLVADAVATRERLEAMGDGSIARAAASLGCCRSTLTERLKLSTLAPDIIEAILAGRQPRSLTRRRLASVNLPIDWQQQRQMLGFGGSPLPLASAKAAGISHTT